MVKHSEDKKLNENIQDIVNQTQCSVEKAKEVFLELGDVIHSILYITEGCDNYNKNENMDKTKQDIEDKDIHVKNIIKLRKIVDEKDTIYESLINS